MESRLFRLPADTTQDELLALVAKLNKAKDEPVHGILVQLPLPPQIDVTRVLHAVSPLKDVDGFHPGKRRPHGARATRGFCPARPTAFSSCWCATTSRSPAATWWSSAAAKPSASRWRCMLMQRGPGGDATVTVCHSKTRNLAEITRQADILIVAIGQPRFITADMVKPGAVVVDVGIHRTDERPGRRRRFRRPSARWPATSRPCPAASAR